MSCIQTNICCPKTGLFLLGPGPRTRRTHFSLAQSCLFVSSPVKFPQRKEYLRLVHSTQKHQRCAPLCASGGQGKSKGEDESFSWESLKKAMGGFRQERSMEDLLRKQMQERDFGGDGSDGNPPGGGGGGDGSSGTEDEGLAGILDELLQVVLATIGFIFVYIYMIRGEELTRLARDYIKYIFGGKTSVRLRRAMHKWRKFYESIARKVVVRDDWLERAIVATPTWWHNPKQLARLYYENYYRRKESED